MGCQVFEELGLREFWREALGAAPWGKVVELLAVNWLIAPRGELFIHEKWFGQTAVAALEVGP